MPRPICFMVMPFGTKDTGAAAPAPARVNFDALWDKALAPLLQELGYQPVRADQDLGGSIISDMLERLYFSDLVLADLSLPNGNVYYEIGVRHAARQNNCVLISANWSKQLFDLQQIRQARYPLPDGEVAAETAKAIQEALRAAILPLARGPSPVFQTLNGYPGEVRPGRASVIREHLEELSAFQARIRAVRTLPQEQREARALELQAQFPPAQIRLPNIALELFTLVRDQVGWAEALAFVDGLPDDIRKLPVLREQRSFAISQLGSHAEAIGALEELIVSAGDTPERRGLLGGRYKRLYNQSKDPADRARYLAKAIEHYEQGMQLDLNDYYPSSNLPRLYRERGRLGDEERARAAATVARMACERAIAHKADNEWTRQTLLGLAFHEGDLEALDELYEQIVADGPAVWKLESTISDLELTVQQTKDEETQDGLAVILEQLKLLPQ